MLLRIVLCVFCRFSWAGEGREWENAQFSIRRTFSVHKFHVTVSLLLFAFSLFDYSFHLRLFSLFLTLSLSVPFASFLLFFRIYFEVVCFVKFIWFKCVLLKISPLTLSLCRSRLTIYCHFCICLCVDICIYMCTATHWAYDEKRIYLQMFLVSYAHARQQQQKKRDRNETTEQNVWYTANGMRSQSSKSVHWLGEWEREGKS